jgi:hypothetical protein
MGKPEQIFSLRCQTEQAPNPKVRRKLFQNDNLFLSSSTPNGGAGRDRTDDILLAKQALSQLSYGPVLVHVKTMVGLDRLELSTSPLSGVRSNHLSYRP